MSTNLVYQQEIADPMFVGKIERSLGRELSEAEKAGEIDLYHKEGKFMDSFEEGALRVEIPTILFPDEG